MDKEVCKFCKNTNEALFSISYPCGHEEKLCIDCIQKNDKNKKCSECSCLKCYKCDKNIVESKSKQIKFSLCKTKNHSLTFCNDCEDESYKKLISKDEKICFLCFVNLEKEKLLYYTEKLNCKDNHEVKLCGKCCEIFEKVDKRCPQCNPFDINQPLCIACYNPMETQIKIMPIMCQRIEHKYNLCLNCTEKLDSPYMICRICQNKKDKNYVFLKTIDNPNDSNNPSLMGIKFVSNEIDKHNTFVDTFSCPFCNEIEAFPLLIKSIEDAPVCWMNPSSSLVNLNGNFLLTGGYNQTLNCSSNSCQFVRFYQDGRIRYYESEELINSMNSKRHSHGSYYSDKERIVYVFGGVSKIKENIIEYLDTVEVMMIPDNSEHIEIDNNYEWQNIDFKLQEKRSNFTVVENQGLVYLFGGFKGIGLMNNSIEVIDLFKKKSRIIKATIPIPFLSFCKNNEKEVLFFGGFDGKTKNDKLLKFNFKTEKLEVVESNYKTFPKRVRNITINEKDFIFSGEQIAKSIKDNGEEIKFLSFNGKTNELGREQNVEAGNNSNIQKLDTSLLDFYQGTEFGFKITTN